MINNTAGNIFNKTITKHDLTSISLFEPDDMDISEILKEIQLSDFQLGDIDLFKSCKIIGNMETSPLLRDKCFESDVTYLYFITDEANTELYVGMDHIHPFFWQKLPLDNFLYDELKIIIDTYHKISYETPMKLSYKACIGTDGNFNMTMDDIEEFIIRNNFLEIFAWGSYWDEYPYREHVSTRRYSKLQLDRMMLYSMRQADNVCISVRTKASKSLVKFEYNNGAYFIDITYDKQKNDSVRKYNDILDVNLPQDVPLDVIGALNLFNFVDYKKMLKSRPIDISQIALGMQLVSGDESYDELIDLLDNIANDRENGDDIVKYARENKLIIELNLKINAISAEKMSGELKELEKNKDKIKLLSLWLCDQTNIDTSNELLVEHVINVSHNLLK